MTGQERPVGEDDLHAFIDGRLHPRRQSAVEAYLAERPEEAGRVSRDRTAREALRERLAAKAAEPVPARLRIAAIAARRRVRLRRPAAWAAAAALLLAVGGSGGWLARDRLGPMPGGAAPAAMAREALAAHRTFAVEVVHPVEVKADQEAHLVQWLSRRLGRRLVVPDLTDAGFGLIGGRLLPAGRREVAAQLMYGGERGERVTLYVRSGDAEPTGYRLMREGNLGSVYWSTGSTGYVLSAPLADDRLRDIARAVAREVEGASGGPTRL